ncbi:acyl carrier protein [Actinokineospora iranica]|uniref:Acyl carrier protein n=1 Tax=Actinokineospora iranica TaxID=1271860 RepID=A0A1G6U626_9PSEU|nr:acyl carrier protein [Actinokineospora iranica]SDD36664.1 Acyl carrier protein [Actinokineospora iranica]
MTSGEAVRADVRAWLCARVAESTGRSADAVDIDLPIAQFGLDSVSALTVVTAAEDEFGIELDPADLWDHPTVRALSERIRVLAENR